jgi:hypothetical protein
VGKEKRKREVGEGKWAMKSNEKRAVDNDKREIVKKLQSRKGNGELSHGEGVSAKGMGERG